MSAAEEITATETRIEGRASSFEYDSEQKDERAKPGNLLTKLYTPSSPSVRQCPSLQPLSSLSSLV